LRRATFRLQSNRPDDADAFTIHEWFRVQKVMSGSEILNHPSIDSVKCGPTAALAVVGWTVRYGSDCTKHTAPA
jgi:hypothetical protein